jgi:hypothetical protein
VVSNDDVTHTRASDWCSLKKVSGQWLLVRPKYCDLKILMSKSLELNNLRGILSLNRRGSRFYEKQGEGVTVANGQWLVRS